MKKRRFVFQKSGKFVNGGPSYVKSRTNWPKAVKAFIGKTAGVQNCGQLW